MVYTDGLLRLTPAMSGSCLLKSLSFSMLGLVAAQPRPDLYFLGTGRHVFH